MAGKVTELPTARKLREENVRLAKVNKELGQTVYELKSKISELEDQIEAPDPVEVAELKEKIEGLEYEVDRLENDGAENDFREELEFLSKDTGDLIRQLQLLVQGNKNFELSPADLLKLVKSWKEDIDRVLANN